MTLGTGIFASTVLIVLVIAIRQITLRKKWKLVGKITAGTVAVCAVIVGCFYAWNYIESLPPAPSVVTELAGVKLGMSPTDVKLALGEPDTDPDPVSEKGQTRVDYIYLEPGLSITFYGKDKYTTKAEIICTSDQYTKLLGFDNLSTEDAIIQRLGTPSKVSVSKDGLNKIISYKKWKAAFSISKGSVTEKCASASGIISFNEELLSPEAQRAADLKAAAEAKAAAAKAAADAEMKAANKQKPGTSNRNLPGAMDVRLNAGAGSNEAGWKSDPIVADRGDPCGPGLSKAERLRRLANFGAVRETGIDTYVAGDHRVSFLSGNQLLSCR